MMRDAAAILLSFSRHDAAIFAASYAISITLSIFTRQHH